MADLNIAVDDCLYLAIVSYKHTVRKYDYTVNTYPKPFTESVALGAVTIGPYTNKAAIKGNLTRWKRRFVRDKAFEITNITLKKTEFDWKEEVF